MKCASCKTFIPDNAFKREFSGYKLYSCGRCALSFWHALKKTDRKYYEDEKIESYVLCHKGIRTRLTPPHTELFRYLPRKSGRLLDIGCADGLFLKYAQEHGYDVCGIDFDRKSIDVAKRINRIKNVFPVPLEKFVKGHGRQFDIVTMFEVIEHQTDPYQFLKTVKKLLKAGGYIAGSVPLTNFLTSGSDWNLPPHHFMRFNKQALTFLLKSCGFRDIFIRNIRWPVLGFLAEIEKKIPFLYGLRRLLKKRLAGFFRSREEAAVLENSNARSARSARSAGRKSLKVRLLGLLRFLQGFLILFFLPVYLYLLIFQKGLNIYFQAKLDEKGR